MKTAYEFDVTDHEVSFKNDIPASDYNFKDVPVTNGYDIKLSLAQIIKTIDYLVDTYKRQISNNVIHGTEVDDTLVCVIGVLSRAVNKEAR